MLLFKSILLQMKATTIAETVALWPPPVLSDNDRSPAISMSCSNDDDVKISLE